MFLGNLDSPLCACKAFTKSSFGFCESKKVKMADRTRSAILTALFNVSKGVQISKELKQVGE